MATSVADLVATLRSDNSSFDSAMANSANNALQFGAAVQSQSGALSALGDAMGTVATVAGGVLAAGLAAAVSSAKQFNDMIAAANVSFQGFGETATNASSNIKAVVELANQLGVSQSSMLTASEKLQGLTGGAANTAQMLTTLAGAAATTGVPITMLTSQIGYLFQAFSAGDTSIGFMGRAMVREGLLGQDTLDRATAMTKAGVDIGTVWNTVVVPGIRGGAAAAELQANTMNGVTTSIKGMLAADLGGALGPLYQGVLKVETAFRDMLNSPGVTAFFAMISTEASKAIPFLEHMATAIEAFGSSGAAGQALVSVTDSLSKLEPLLATLAGIGAGAGLGFLGELPIIGSALAPLAAVFSPIVTGIIAFIASSKEGRDALMNFANAVGNLLSSLSPLLGVAVEFLNILTPIAAWLLNAAAAVINFTASNRYLSDAIMGVVIALTALKIISVVVDGLIALKAGAEGVALAMKAAATDTTLFELSLVRLVPLLLAAGATFLTFQQLKKDVSGHNWLDFAENVTSGGFLAIGKAAISDLTGAHKDHKPAVDATKSATDAFKAALDQVNAAMDAYKQKLQDSSSLGGTAFDPATDSLNRQKAALTAIITTMEGKAGNAGSGFFVRGTELPSLQNAQDALKSFDEATRAKDNQFALAQAINNEAKARDSLTKAIEAQIKAQQVLQQSLDAQVSSVSHMNEALLGHKDAYYNIQTTIDQLIPSQLGYVQAVLDSISATTQLQNAFDALNVTYTATNNQLTQVTDQLNIYKAAANIPLQGSGAFAEAIHQNQMAQDSIKLLIDKDMAAGMYSNDPKILALNQQLAVLKNTGDQLTLNNNLTLGDQQFQLQQAQKNPIEQTFSSAMDAAKQVSILQVNSDNLTKSLNSQKPALDATNAALQLSQSRTTLLVGALQAMASADTAVTNAQNSLLSATNGVKSAQDALASSVNAVQKAEDALTRDALQAQVDVITKLIQQYKDLIQAMTDAASASTSAASTIATANTHLNNDTTIGQAAATATSAGIQTTLTAAANVLHLTLSSTDMANLTKLVMNESGGSASAVNPNAVIDPRTGANLGHATGFMQTLPGTFSGNALPGYGDILNGVDNAIAGLRYILGRYHGDFGAALAASLAGGYAGGGLSTSAHLANISEGNTPELILPLNDQRRSMALLAADAPGLISGGGGGSVAIHSGAVVVSISGVSDPVEAGAQAGAAVEEALSNIVAQLRARR